MTRLLAVLVLALSPSAFAATPEKPAEPAPATPPPAQAAPAAAVAPDTAAPVTEKELIRREVMEEVKKALDKQKEEVRDEVRAQVATQTANRALEEEFQFHEEKKKLELFELNGYLRLRPELFHQFDLHRGPDPAGYSMFAIPFSSSDPLNPRKTITDANMRWRLEPTLNVSEDVRVHAQIDLLDNLILGSTPNGGFGISERTQWDVLSTGQDPPTADKNWLQNSVVVRRVYGEVNTPIGQFVFGRMGNQWGLGMLHSAGNGVDSDYGDTVDRIMFVAKVADHYIIPMLDFVSTGPTSISKNETQGQPYDLDQLDDAHDYSLAIARRDTELELSRKLQAGQYVINYGATFTYRRQTEDAAAFYKGTNPNGGDQTNLAMGRVARNAEIYIPDIWAKLQTRKLRIEIEAAGVFGKIGDAAAFANMSAEENQAVYLRQFGAVLQAEYKVLDALNINLEFGFASGDRAPGMGNKPGRGVTSPGSIDGQQYCVASSCARKDNEILNFRFNRDYRVDLILWREIYDGVTDAIYIRPGAKYEITEGLGIWANLVYSRAIYGESTPSSHLDASTGQLTGDPNLGVEIDGGVRYDSGDGFQAGIAYGVLFPLDGMKSFLDPANPRGGSTAQTVRGWFVIKY